MSLRGRDLLCVDDLTPEEIGTIMSVSRRVKDLKRGGQPHSWLQGKILGMIFRKSSTRTRVSFEAGMYQLGGSAIYLNDADSQMGRGEPIKDTARVLSAYVDAIMIRTFSQADVEELAQYATVPVINGLTDQYHPCQALADIFTAYEFFGDLAGKKLAYIGDSNNVVNSLLSACSKIGMDITVASPLEYQPEGDMIRQARQNAEKSGSKICITQDVAQAAIGADVLYTDVWASMGQEAETAARKAALKSFQIDSKLLKLANSEAIVMHCLPAHRGEEITDEVMESKQSVVFQQAENRLHVQKAVMALLMGGINENGE